LLKTILQSFADSTGLCVNYAKSMMVPINVDDSKMSSLAQSLGCSIGSLPFTYLGLPLGLTKLKLVDFLPLVTRCERRFTYTSSLLSQARRLEVTNSIFTSFPMFFTSTFQLHKSVIKQMDNFKKHCLWQGADINAKFPPKSSMGNGMFA